MSEATKTPRVSEIEARSIDWVPDTERHGKPLAPGPALVPRATSSTSRSRSASSAPVLGLSLGWTILAGASASVIGTLVHGLPRVSGPDAGSAPDDPVARAVRLPRRRGRAVRDAVHLPGLQRGRPGAARPAGSTAAFGWNANVVAIVATVGAALLAIYGHDWVHRVFADPARHLVAADDIVTVGDPARAGWRTCADDPLRLLRRRVHGPVLGAAAYNITYAPYVSDYSRYLPREHPGRHDHRLGVLRRVRLGHLADRAGRVAGDPAGRTTAWSGLQTAGNNVFDAPRLRRRVPVRARPGGHDGHERVRRHADRPDRRSTRSAPIKPTPAARSSPSSR